MLFNDRLDAGRKLSESLFLPSNSVVFAIPRGGVPVGYAISEYFRIPFDVVVVRKLPIPWNREAGFGAMTLDGNVIINPYFKPYIDEKTVKSVTRDVYREILRRNEVYRNGKGYRSLKGKVAVVVDDGFASGYTALAACSFLKKLNPAKVLAVSPVCSEHARKVLEVCFDEVHCLIESEASPFAVADFYADFHDLSDEEVLGHLKSLRQDGLLWVEDEHR